MSAPRLVARPLTAEGFAPFGEVLQVPPTAGARAYFSSSLENLRPAAPASLSVILAAPSRARPVPVTVIERHRFSSQSFIPMAEARWLVVAAPDAGDRMPDLARAAAFLPAPGQGVTLKAGVWHAPLTVLDGPRPFAILMWRDFGPEDEDFAAVAPFSVAV